MLVTKLDILPIGDTWISSRVRSSPGRWKNPRGELIKHLCRWTSSMSGLISSWRPWPYPAWTFWVYRQITVFIVSSFETGPAVQVSTERSMFLRLSKCSLVANTDGSGIAGRGSHCQMLPSDDHPNNAQIFVLPFGRVVVSCVVLSVFSCGKNTAASSR